MSGNTKNFCIILAGGRGRRLWPCSRNKQPKQFIDFFGRGRTQLQETYDRFTRIVPAENILVCTNHEYEHFVVEQLPDIPRENIFVESVNRNTAPSVAWANLQILSKCDDANVVISPSDMLVLDSDEFIRSVSDGLDFVASHDILLSMGVQPTRAEPGYGYIQMGDRTDKEGIYCVKSFTEKPEREFANIFVESKEFLWNTGLFVSNCSFLEGSFHEIFTEVHDLFVASKTPMTPHHVLEFMRNNYSSFPNLSIDYAILERYREVFVMNCKFGWADLGTWHSIYEFMSHQPSDNVIIDSNVILEDCANNVIKLSDNKLAILNGLDGYIVAEKDNVLLICRKGDSSSLIRKYVNEVQIKYGEEYV